MFFIIIGIILLSGIGILLFKISISIELVNIQEDEKFIISISILNRLLKMDIPLIDSDNKKDWWGVKLFKKFLKSKAVKKDTKKDGKKETKLSFSKIKDSVVKGYELYKTYKDILVYLKKYIRKKLICNRLMFHLDFGLGDAAVTGITSGVVWGSCYNILSIIDNNCILKETDIKINPEFNELKMNVKLYCIFTLRIVHIIIVFFILLWAFFKILLKSKVFFNQKQIKHKAV